MPAQVSNVPTPPESEDTVATESVAYQGMSGHWDLIHALLGGTEAMRDAGETWLPQEPSETPDAYSVRLNRSFLHPAYKNTVQTITSKPFVRPAGLQGDLPEGMEEITSDVTGAGEDLSQFAHRLFDTLLNYGLAHILVDYAKVEDPESTTKADEQAIGARPRFVSVSPIDLIAFLTEDNPTGGPPVLTQIRFRETRVEPDGNYSDKEVEYIRVYNRDSWELWKKIITSEKKVKYVLKESGRHTFGRVPLVTCYINRTGFLTALPPLEDLAWLNLAHWQSMSDQRNILRYARVALLFGAGFTRKEIEKGIVLGPDRLVGSTNKEAKLSYVEHSGKSIAAGQEDIDKLEERMEILGLQPFIRRSGGATATGRAIDEGKRQSDVQSWIRSLENILTDAYGMAAEWLKLTLPDNFKVNIFNEFGLSIKAPTDVEALFKSRQAGEISHPTYLTEIKRRGLLSETVNVEEEVAAVEAEGPALSEMTRGGAGGFGGAGEGE